MIRISLSTIGAVAVAAAALLLGAGTSQAAGHGGGGHGGGGHGGGGHGGGHHGGSAHHGGGHDGHHHGGYPFFYGAFLYPGYGYGYGSYYPRRYYYDYDAGYWPDYYYGAAPNYPGAYSSLYSAPSPPASAEVRLLVDVPPGAELWIGETRTAQRGSPREFISPPLQPGSEYVYDLHARWLQDGREVERDRQITVHAGDRLRVDLTRR
jgi:uncharacterized protein (TIGR03000 family)